MLHEPQLTSNLLMFACQCESLDNVKDETVRSIIEFLDYSHVGPDVRVRKRFQSEVCLCLS